ncbi:MAG: hypothetical protein D6753_03465 [Planctomycetota bacterium]|nr:MAG: hypothetical protein D6753_03465 [Planctomycetota bacterium]
MIARALILLAFLGLAQGAVGQDPFGSDPFGAPTQDPFGGPAANQKANADTGGFDAFGGANSPMVGAASMGGASSTSVDDLLKEVDPVVRILRESPPQTPAEIGRAIAWLVRLKQWQEVAGWIDRLAAMNLDVQQKALVARAAGPLVLARLRGGEAELNDSQMQFVAELQQAPGQVARDPRRIDAWIDRLASDVPAQRVRAQNALHDAGAAAVQRLVQRLIDGNDAPSAEILVQTLAGMDRDGRDALRAALLVADPAAADRIAVALAAQPRVEFAAELGALSRGGVVSPDATEQVRSLLLKHYGRLPDAQRVTEFLEREFTARLTEYQRVRVEPPGASEPVWRLTPDRLGVEMVQDSEAAAALERWADLAALRLKTLTAAGGATDQIVASAAAVTQRAYHVHPQLIDAELDSHLLVEIPGQRSQDPAFWTEVFHTASQLQMHGAALRAVQRIGQIGLDDPQTLDFLSRALGDTRPVVRYAVLEAVAGLDPAEPYAGVERAIETAIEATRLGAGPHVLVVGLHADLRQVAQQQLQMVGGADVSVASTLQSAMLILDDQRPVEMVLVVDRVPDDSVSQLLQRIRRTRRGHAIPIAVLTDKLYPHEREWIAGAGGVITGLLTRDAENMREVFNRLLATLDTRPMEPADRLHFALIGERFLSRIASDRDRYRFYPLEQWQQDLLAVARGVSDEARVQLYVGLPTAVAQQRLVETAGEGRAEESVRLAAARAFAQSVGRHGLLLSRDAVLQCYELYNRLGPNDPVAVRALGHILDVIEAHAAGQELPAGP